MKPSTQSPFPTLLRACAVITAVALAGCQTTVDAQWATRDDTVYRWQHALPTLPVDVRGHLPGTTNEDVVRAIPHAVSPETHEGARLIVEIGDDAAPRDGSYCSTQGPADTKVDIRAPLMLTLTLCDGLRLVASSSAPLQASKNDTSNLPRQIDRLKNLMLIGIDESPAQFSGIQG